VEPSALPNAHWSAHTGRSGLPGAAMGKYADDFKKGAWTPEVSMAWDGPRWAGVGRGANARQRLWRWRDLNISCTRRRRRPRRGWASGANPASLLPVVPLEQEDDLLRHLIGEYGAKNWSIIANGIKGRSGKSCRLRCGGRCGGSGVAAAAILQARAAPRDALPHISCQMFPAL
jgi:hypothetical protein